MAEVKRIEEESSSDEDEVPPHPNNTSSLSQLPVIGGVVNKANKMYGAVKESNPAVKTVLNATESTLKVVGSVGGPMLCSAAGCLAAAAIPGAGAAINNLINSNNVQPVVGVVCAAAHVGLKKLFRRRNRN